MATYAHPAVVAGLRALKLYDRRATEAQGYTLADCPICKTQMRVDRTRFDCYAGRVVGHWHAEIERALLAEPGFVQALAQQAAA